MKNSILIFILIGVITFACQGQETKSKKSDQVNQQDQPNQVKKIQLKELSDQHPNKGYMEHFLNFYKEEFIETKPDEKPLKLEHLVQNKFTFQTKETKVDLILIFCDHQNDAIAICDANFFEQDGYFCGVNGAVLFVAKGKNEDDVMDILQWFAGEE